MTTTTKLRRGALPATLTLAFSFCVAPWASAQDPPGDERKNGVYAELVGASLGMTVNYERTLAPRFYLRLGGGFAADDANFLPSVIAMPGVVFGKGRHHFSAGLGVLGLFPDPSCTTCAGQAADWTLASEAAYRYQARSGFLFRATVGLVLFRGDTSEDTLILPLPGVSVGWRF
jgi:hypothetical protein